MNFRNLIAILVIGVSIFACNKDKDDSFDASAQALLDDTSLTDYLQSHYLNDVDGGIWTITNGETPLMDNIKTQEITYNEIDYKLYYLQENEGVTDSPSSVDSIYYNYTGMLLDSTVFDSGLNFSWSYLNSFIPGWQYGFTNFKGGDVVVDANDGSFYFENYGKGVLFIPSGLAYGNQTGAGNLKNSPLIFEISLKSVHLTDHDLDGILSKDEDLNGDNDLTNDDTDGDGIPNYVDVDDDGDGILTKNEV